MRCWKSLARWSRDRSDNVIVIIVTDLIEVRGLPEDNPDQRGKR